MEADARYATWTSFLIPTFENACSPISVFKSNLQSSKCLNFSVLGRAAHSIESSDSTSPLHSVRSTAALRQHDDGPLPRGENAVLRCRFGGRNRAHTGCDSISWIPAETDAARYGKEVFAGKSRERTKRESMIPIGRWFCNELRDYVESQFTCNRSPAIVDFASVQSMWEEHSCRADHGHVLWAVLLLFGCAKSVANTSSLLVDIAKDWVGQDCGVDPAVTITR